MIYTKCGDKGKSSVINKKDIDKDNSIFSLLGDIDELGACLGICKHRQSEGIANKIASLQKDLLELAAWIAGYKEFDAKGRTGDFEVVIDTLCNSVDMPNHIITSGETEECAYIDYCRTLARRCERGAVAFCREYGFDTSLLTYLNRLSDYLFVLARYAQQL